MAAPRWRIVGASKTTLCLASRTEDFLARREEDADDGALSLQQFDAVDGGGPRFQTNSSVRLMESRWCPWGRGTRPDELASFSSRFQGLSLSLPREWKESWGFRRARGPFGSRLNGVEFLLW